MFVRKLYAPRHYSPFPSIPYAGFLQPARSTNVRVSRENVQSQECRTRTGMTGDTRTNEPTNEPDLFLFLLPSFCTNRPGGEWQRRCSSKHQQDLQHSHIYKHTHTHIQTEMYKIKLEASSWLSVSSHDDHHHCPFVCVCLLVRNSSLDRRTSVAVRPPPP